jgi:hypothetical protein
VVSHPDILDNALRKCTHYYTPGPFHVVQKKGVLVIDAMHKSVYFYIRTYKTSAKTTTAPLLFPVGDTVVLGFHFATL